jgi:hypothetical protein
MPAELIRLERSLLQIIGAREIRVAIAHMVKPTSIGISNASMSSFLALPARHLTQFKC